MRTAAIVFTAIGTTELADIDLPDPRPLDVVVEVDASGISVGTERWAMVGKRPEMAFPHVPGYMGLGRVVEAGADAAARGWKPGMGIVFARSRLRAPHDGNSWMGAHLARAVVDVCNGVDPVPGGHDFMRVAEIPAGIDPITAAPVQLAAVAMRGIEMTAVKAGATVLVVGAGVIGQFAAQIVRLKGARVAVSDPQAGRRDIARRLGAEWTSDGSSGNLRALAERVVPGGFDIIIDTASIPAVIDQVVPLLKVHGTFIFQGWYPPPSALDLNALHGRLPTCLFPCGHTAAHTVAALRWVRDGRLDSRALVTRVLRPEEAPSFYRHMAGSSEAFLGAAIDWRRRG